MPDQAGRQVGDAPSSSFLFLPSASSFLLPLGLIDGSMLIMVVKRGEEVAIFSETHLAQKKKRERKRLTGWRSERLHYTWYALWGRQAFLLKIQREMSFCFLFLPLKLFLVLMMITETQLFPFLSSWWWWWCQHYSPSSLNQDLGQRNKSRRG